MTGRCWKGIFYFPGYGAARTYAAANSLPADRIICYGRGWAIQRERSGPYWGPKGWK